MRRRFARHAAPAVALSACLLTACYFTSERPLPPDPGVDADLLGVWRPLHTAGEPPSPGDALVVTARRNVMLVQVVEAGGTGGDTYVGFAARAGGEKYLCVESVRVSADPPRVGAQPGFAVGHYRFAREGGLVMTLLDVDVIRSAVAEKRLAGEIQGHRYGDTIRVTDSGDRFAAFLASRPVAELLEKQPLLVAKRYRFAQVAETSSPGAARSGNAPVTTAGHHR